MLDQAKSKFLQRLAHQRDRIASAWVGLSDHSQVGVTLVGVSGVLALWALFWPVPTEVKGHGVLIYPDNAGVLNARVDGQVLKIKTQVGDSVRQGQVLMTLYLPVLERQLQQQRGNLAQLESINDDLNQRDAMRLGTEKTALEVTLAKLEDDVRRYSALQNTFSAKLSNLEWLSQRQVVAPLSRAVVSVQQGFTDTSVNLDDVKINRKQILTDYQQVKLTIETEALKRQFRIDDLRRQIAVTEAQIEFDGTVVAGRDGHVLDLQVIPGQTVKLQDRLGTIGNLAKTTTKAPDLKAVAYYSPADARRLPLGLPVEVVPQWKQRGRFGGIVGKVSSVLTLPSTEEDVATTTGNPELAKALTKDGPVMRAEIELERDVSSLDGYRWTLSWGSGVFPIREGLTATSHAYVEWRSPLSYVIPGLRSLTGGYRTLRLDRLWNRSFLQQPDTIE
ncbi:MAG: NHLP bacteriocin system secretion protein [Synechococcus sp. TMED19]|nr:MAG: NHLP bacteriocin system secretion protein [Synechococcus sp. TMED19]